MKLRKAKLLFLALLLATGGNVLAQGEGRANDSFDGGPEPHIEAPPPAEPPPAEAPPDDSSSAASPDTPVSTDTPDSAAPEEPDGRYAVPVTEPVEPHRQRPHRGHSEPNPPGEPPSGDDDYVPEEVPDASYTAYEDDETYSSPGGGPMRPTLGALDLDLSPGRTQVYLDGSYLGIVDQFDGWPSYLLLPEGSYELVFYLDGYKTRARRVAILPGTVIKMNDRLEPGPSILPEDIFSR